MYSRLSIDNIISCDINVETHQNKKNPYFLKSVTLKPFTPLTVQDFSIVCYLFNRENKPTCKCTQRKTLNTLGTAVLAQ